MTTETYSEVGQRRPWIAKGLRSKLDYSVDVRADGWLQDGELIASYSVTVAGVTLESQSRLDGKMTAWVSQGTAIADEWASIRFDFTTDSVPPRVDQRTLHLKIRER